RSACFILRFIHRNTRSVRSSISAWKYHLYRKCCMNTSHL
uniref:Uncharacterized protein n=1 Tax=Parascaris univalens TaxID=6257 RepID=A0A915AWX9_PARUN